MFEFLIALLFFVEQAADGSWICWSADADDAEIEAARDGDMQATPEKRERERRQLKRFRMEAEAREWIGRRRDAAARLLKDGQPARSGDKWCVWATDYDQSWQSMSAVDALRDAADAVAKREEGAPPARSPEPK